MQQPDIDSISGDLKKLKVNESQSSLAGIYIFLSFDMVDSTKIKSLYADNWLNLNLSFFKFIEDEFKTKYTEKDQPLLWRYVGDEVIFYQRIKQIDQIASLLKASYDILTSVTDKLKKAHGAISYLIAIRGTVWIANIIEKDSIHPSKDDKGLNKNIIIRDQINQNDFLGLDIDRGFRLSEYTNRNKLTVCADLAFLLLSENNDLVKNLMIVDFKTLKGVWEERKYPIIWYYQDWEKIANSFLYDEENDIIAKVRKKEYQKIEDLKNVYRDLNKENIVTKIKEIIEATNSTNINNFLHQDKNKLSELHCVAICFNKEKQILIAKRASGKNILPNIWEFGCCQVKYGETFENSLEQGYKNDFGIDIKIYKDPFKCYFIEDKKANGVRFIAKVSENPTVTLDDNEHSEFEWITEEYINSNSFQKEAYIPDFKEIAIDAFNLYNKWSSNGQK